MTLVQVLPVRVKSTDKKKSAVVIVTLNGVGLLATEDKDGKLVLTNNVEAAALPVKEAEKLVDVKRDQIVKAFLERQEGANN